MLGVPLLQNGHIFLDAKDIDEVPFPNVCTLELDKSILRNLLVSFVYIGELHYLCHFPHAGIRLRHHEFKEGFVSIRRTFLECFKIRCDMEINYKHIRVSSVRNLAD